MRGNRTLQIRMLLAACTGVAAWSGSIVLIPLSLALPLLCHWPSENIDWHCRSLVAFVYYAVALWPVTAAGVQLYGFAAIPFLLAVTVIVAGLLAAAWVLRSTVLALILTAVPPIGIFGVAHPLTAAGFLFPSAGWFGLAVTLLLPWALIRFSRIAVGMALLTSLTLNLLYYPPQPPAGWQGIDTTFGDIRDKKDASAEFRAAQSIQETALNSHARVLVFPELAVTRWTEATEAFWQPTLEQLAKEGRTVLIGAGIPTQSTRDYQNVLMKVPSASGIETHYVPQRISLPWLMWNPLASKDRVPLRPWGSGILEVAGERAAVLICYEQLIPWPVLTIMAERPTVVVAVSNAVWTRRTPIPAVQAASVESWSRLFGLPSVSSVNQ